LIPVMDGRSRRKADISNCDNAQSKRSCDRFEG
jgi:hypothetical protein